MQQCGEKFINVTLTVEIFLNDLIRPKIVTKSFWPFQQVFKAESINDSFIIGSGIPNCIGEKLGNRHVTEIANLVFDLMAAFTKMNNSKNTQVQAWNNQTTLNGKWFFKYYLVVLGRFE